VYDVIIVGGNLSGAYAAIKASEYGVKCALIERHTEPYNPAHCGEGIADVVVNQLGLDNIGCNKNQIDRIKLNLSNIKEYNYKLSKHKLFIINRNHLEKHLLEKSKNSDVDIFLGRNVVDFNPPYEIILDNNKKLKGKIVIDASGIACRIGNKLKLNTKLKPEDVGICIQSRVKGSFQKNCIHLWYHKPYAPFGYAWLFPIDSNTANIGFGIPGGIKLDFKKTLLNYINFETNNNYEILNTFRSCVPMAPPMKKLSRNNIMFVGDAARLVNPATGAGIHFAIISGGFAGKIAANFIKGKIKSLDSYTDEMQCIIRRLEKTYRNKTKLRNDEEFVSAYKKAFSKLNIANKILPGFFQNYVAKRLQNDINLLEKY